MPYWQLTNQLPYPHISTPAHQQDFLSLGNLLMWIAALLTLWSMGYYLHKAWPEIAKRTGAGL